MAKKELPSETAAPGRPRSEASRRAVLEATISLLNTTTVRDLTIEAIAHEAGVGKTTIYRWWPGKTAVAVEAFIEVMLPNVPVPHTSSAGDDISSHLLLLVRRYNGKLGRIVAQLLAEGQSEPEMLADFRQRFFAGRRVAIREVIERGIRNGEFDSKLDVEIALDTLYGAIYFRLILGHLPLDQEFGKALARFAMSILKAKPKSGR
ncbi:TetR family transcriptional regulator [Bradyrhizobium betae]|uniref:TetR family transcriptional regulator n=2 Tax=Bradyrhizobium betae TaxID=244734 RepID=A0A4Q1VAQ4_9BRAD|nr:TetR family transcriptional regulator [Bradyrhizobium betae]